MEVMLGADPVPTPLERLFFFPVKEREILLSSQGNGAQEGGCPARARGASKGALI